MSSHQLSSREPFGRVWIQTDDVFARCMRCERPFTLWAVYFGQDDFIVGIADLDVHANTRTWRGKSVGPRVVQLNLVISCKMTRMNGVQISLASLEWTDFIFFINPQLGLLLFLVEWTSQGRSEREKPEQVFYKGNPIVSWIYLSHTLIKGGLLIHEGCFIFSNHEYDSSLWHLPFFFQWVEKHQSCLNNHITKLRSSSLKPK